MLSRTSSWLKIRTSRSIIPKGRPRPTNHTEVAFQQKSQQLSAFHTRDTVVNTRPLLFASSLACPTPGLRSSSRTVNSAFIDKSLRGISAAKPLFYIAHTLAHSTSPSSSARLLHLVGFASSGRSILIHHDPKRVLPWPSYSARLDCLSAPPPTKTTYTPRHQPFALLPSSARYLTMSTLSQPQTPAALDSPFREHRHRPVERVTDLLETPSLDNRSYRVIRLPNQLEVLLVHDAETDKASAAMDVNVGNFSDPAEFPGMAHAVEHLLFMGTKKYPVENAYSSYLSAHSGSSNAYTASTSTNYYFEVAAKPAEDGSESETSPLYGALDRFAQFFIEPLFLSSTLDRELRAVDSENKKNLQSDTWRLSQLDKSLSNPKHPYCHFSTGNLDTLKILPEAKGIDVRSEFMKFHEKHYSANRMKLVILGREPLNTLEEWAADLFAGVKNKDLSQNRWENEEPMSKNELLTQCFAKPVMDQRILEMYFPFLDEETLFETQPSRYISHLIGHEGPGSVMAYIKSKGWANGLSAGAYGVCPGTLGMFNVQIRLTEDGLKNYHEIVKVLFQYISLLKETPPKEWIFEEQKGMAEVDFKFKQKQPASKFTSKISAVMQKPLPREWLLSGSQLRKFDPEGIKSGLAFLRPDNFKMSIVSQKYPGNWDMKEKWYGTEYKYEKIPEDFLAEVKKAGASTNKDRLPELYLPHKNQFIPTKLEVEKKEVKQPSLAPKLIRNDELVRGWYKKDDTFWVPKANLFINCRNPLPNATAENALKARVYTDMVRDTLEEYSYDAELAGLEYSVYSFSGGLDIQLAGYNDKLPVLLEKVLVTMRDLVIKPARFEVVKERLLRGMQNYDYQQPYNQVGDYTRWLNRVKGFINDQLLVELPRLTTEDIQSYFPQLLQQMHIEILVHGNMYKEDALRLMNLVENTLKPRSLPQVQWPVRRGLIFPPGSSYVYKKTLKDPKNVNHCIEYVLYVGDRADGALRSKVLLFDQMTHEPAFDQLRTKEQLGYVVFSGTRFAATSVGYRFIIQSERTPEYLDTRIDAFLTDYFTTMNDMSDADFEGHKRSLITKRLEKMKNLDQESSRHWQHIDNEYFDFELVHQDAAYIKALTKTDMIEFFKRYISPASPARAKLAVHLIAQGTSAVTGVDVTVAAGVKDISLSPKIETVEKKETSEAPSGTAENPYIIKNVREYKSRLAASAGPQPVKDLSEFEELDSKL